MQRLATGILLVLLTGCLAHPTPSSPASSPTVPAHAAPAPARTLDWRMKQCQAMTWSVPVLASDLQPYLPAGFKPAGDGPASAGVDQATTIGFQAVECASGLGQKTVLRSVQTGTLFTAVLPPTTLREDRFSGHYTFGWDVLVAPHPWRAKAAGWGLPIHEGGSQIGPSAEGFTGAFAMDNVGTFTVTGRTLESPSSVAAHESRTITRATGGFALWDVGLENHTASTGVGVWDATPGSWVAKLLGATQGAATFTLARWDQPDGVVHWPGEARGPTDAPSGAPLGERPPPPLGTPSFDERPMGLL